MLKLEEHFYLHEIYLYKINLYEFTLNVVHIEFAVFVQHIQGGPKK